MKIVSVDNGPYLFALAGIDFSIGSGLYVDSVGSDCLAKLEVKKGEQFYCLFKRNIPCFVRVHDFLQNFFITGHLSTYYIFRNASKKEIFNLKI